MTRDVASRFHSKMGETFIIPEAKVQDQTKLIQGTDGQKMSKSKGHAINIFLTDKALRKQIMSIKTDSTPLEAPKDWAVCNCFAIYELLASKQALETMKDNYQAGGYGYGDASKPYLSLYARNFLLNVNATIII
jgi:tryptophanyl-tRNA synthetase